MVTPLTELFSSFPLRVLGLYPLVWSDGPGSVASWLYSLLLAVALIASEAAFFFSKYTAGDLSSLDPIQVGIGFISDAVGGLAAVSAVLETNHIYPRLCRLRRGLLAVDKEMRVAGPFPSYKPLWFLFYMALWSSFVVYLSFAQSHWTSISQNIKQTINVMDCFRITWNLNQIRVRFERINNEIVNILDIENAAKENGMSPKLNSPGGAALQTAAARRLRALGSLHVELCGAVADNNSHYGNRLILVMASLFTYLLVHFDNVLVMAMATTHPDREKLGTSLAWILLYLALSYYVHSTGSHLTDAAQEATYATWKKIHKNYLNPMRSEMEVFLMKTDHSNYEVHAHSLFKVNIDTFGAMFESVLYQLTILYTVQVISKN